MGVGSHNMLKGVLRLDDRAPPGGARKEPSPGPGAADGSSRTG
jgi:hypothetical protein